MAALEDRPPRRVLLATVLMGIVAVSAYLLSNAKLGQAAEGECPSFAVTIEQFGVDSREIERTIAMPLENELARIAGVRDLRSVSEYGKAKATITMESGADRGSIYLQVRDAADRVYSALPSSAQKPQIASSSSSQRPVFAVSLRAAGLGEEAFRELVDKEIKPAFEKVSGVGEIEVGGGSVKEVHVLVDSAKAAERGLSISSVAEQIQRQDFTGPAGPVRVGSLELPVSLHGRIASLDELAKLGLTAGKSTLRLGDVAVVSYAGRESESVSRIDGEKMIVLGEFSRAFQGFARRGRPLEGPRRRRRRHPRFRSGPEKGARAHRPGDGRRHSRRSRNTARRGAEFEEVRRSQFDDSPCAHDRGRRALGARHRHRRVRPLGPRGRARDDSR